ncbi:butyrophilin subfamily 2 member A1-like [Tautogolabrus adspersus]
MRPLKDGWPSNHQHSSISSVLFHQTVVLLFLTPSCSAQSLVFTPSQLIVATVGEDIVLPCYLYPPVDATDLTVEWRRPDLDPRFVYVWRGGVELGSKKHPSYEGRTSMSLNKLKHGDISLKVHNVKLSDEGTYGCFIPTLNREATVELLVGAVSSLIISFGTTETDGDIRRLLLQCESEGWYPEPEVLWLDSEGILLSAGSTETVRGPDDLYTVSSRVTVERRHNNMFTCRVTQNNINQTREAHISVSDELFMVQSSSIIRITICVGVCVVSIVAVVLVVRKYGQNKKNKKHHEGEPDLAERQKFRHDIEHRLLLEKGDGDQPMKGNENMKLLDNIKAEQDEKLEKKEEELEHVQQVITILMEQKKDLKIQREKLISLQQEDMVQIAKNLKKLKDTSDTIFEKDKKKKREKTKEDLEKRKTVHDNLLKNTGTQLDSTDVLINTMKERKGKLENDKEQIKKYIKETERKREEVQRQIQIQQDRLQRQQSEKEDDQRKHPSEQN